MGKDVPEKFGVNQTTITRLKKKAANLREGEYAPKWKEGTGQLGLKINKMLLKLNYLVLSSLTLHNQIIGLTFYLQTMFYGTKKKDLYFTQRIANAAGVNLHTNLQNYGIQE